MRLSHTGLTENACLLMFLILLMLDLVLVRSGLIFGALKIIAGGDNKKFRKLAGCSLFLCFVSLTHAGKIQSIPAPKCRVATTQGSGSSLRTTWLDLSRAAPSANISVTNAAVFAEPILFPSSSGFCVFSLQLQ